MKKRKEFNVLSAFHGWTHPRGTIKYSKIRLSDGVVVRLEPSLLRRLKGFMKNKWFGRGRLGF